MKEGQAPSSSAVGGKALPTVSRQLWPKWGGNSVGGGIKTVRAALAFLIAVGHTRRTLSLLWDANFSSASHTIPLGNYLAMVALLGLRKPTRRNCAAGYSRSGGKRRGSAVHNPVISHPPLHHVAACQPKLLVCLVRQRAVDAVHCRVVARVGTATAQDDVSVRWRGVPRYWHAERVVKRGWDGPFVFTIPLPHHRPSPGC